ncbi:MAG: hypothetical protein ACRYFX_10810 [Janthinobacterium lividum]
MAYLLRYADGSAQVLNGRVAITLQDNDLTKVDSIQASWSTGFSLPNDVATHARLGLAQLGTSLSAAPYQGLAACLEAGGVEVLPGARLTLDDYTPRTGYTGKLLAGNKSFYDLLGEKKLRELDLSDFDHDWTLGGVAAGAAHTGWQQGYVYDLYDRGLGTPPLPTAGSSRLYEAGYWPTAYARAVWEAIFAGVGVKWSGDLPAIFDTALLPATAPFGYSEKTRAAVELVAGYAVTDTQIVSHQERDEVIPYHQVTPTKDDMSLHQGSQAAFNAQAHTYTVTVPGYYDLKAEQTVFAYCTGFPLPGEVSVAVEIQVNGQRLDVDSIRGSDSLYADLTALAERQLLQVGDVVVARYKFDKWKGTGGGPFNEEWKLRAKGRLTVELLADFPPRGRVHLSDWLPDMTCKDYVKTVVQLYGLTQTTDPYTGAVQFRRTATVLDNPRATGVDWTELRDGSQPAKRSWRLGDFAQRNWFRWKEDESNPEYAHAQWARTHTGLGWDDDAAKAAANAYGAGYLDNGAGDTSLAATKDVLTLPFAASPVGAESLLLVPYWKPKQGTDYAADLQVIADALANGNYNAAEAEAARVKALGDDFDTQAPAPRLCYQLSSTRDVKLEDDHGNTLTVPMRLSYFVLRSQDEDLDWQRSLLQRYYPHLAAALVWPLVLRPYVRLTAVQVVDFDQLVPVWIGGEESAFFFCNKVDSWEEGQPSTAVELIRL